LQSKIVGIPDGYIDKEEYYDQDGFQDYTDYAKYMYETKDIITSNKDYKKIEQDDVQNIVGYFEDFSGIVDRFKFTDVWKDGGITKLMEYAMLTNEIYKDWSGMKANEYKAYNGLRKESLRDNMTDIEVALTNIGEIAA
jgi:hypothetical protein